MTLLSGLLRSAVNRPIVLILILGLGGLKAIAQFFFLGGAQSLPLLDDHHDDIGLAHGRELVAVLVVTLPRELTVRAAETRLLRKHLFIMDKHGLKSLKAIDLEGKYERAVKGTIRAQECREG